MIPVVASIVVRIIIRVARLLVLSGLHVIWRRKKMSRTHTRPMPIVVIRTIILTSLLERAVLEKVMVVMV